jgi:hypothetical protein
MTSASKNMEHMLLLILPNQAQVKILDNICKINKSRLLKMEKKASLGASQHKEVHSGEISASSFHTS